MTDQKSIPKEDNLPVCISRAETELMRLLEWSKAAESRLSLVLPLSTAMLTAVAVLAPKAAKWTVSAGILSSFAALFLILSIIFAAIAALPRTTGPKGSLIYFESIITKDSDQFKEAFISMTSEDYLDDLICQCHRNAQIAERKYTSIQRSMACLFIAAIPWLLSIYSLYSLRQ